ncbi:element excision factor XisH family protein, partial [Dolichospermum flos-aquae]
GGSNVMKITEYHFSNILLYLAVPITVYNEFFILPFIQSVIKTNQLCLVVYNIEQEVISQWQN